MKILVSIKSRWTQKLHWWVLSQFIDDESIADGVTQEWFQFESNEMIISKEKEEELKVKVKEKFREDDPPFHVFIFRLS